MSADNSILEYAIVGAGLTGLTLAYELNTKLPLAAANRQIQIFEKSRGCGGRMATRRVDGMRFDHGAQFISRAPVAEKWIEVWQKAGVIRPFLSDTKSALCGLRGMTDLAKVLAQDLTIRYGEKITSLERFQHNWLLGTEHGDEIWTRHVVLTSPLPQSLELLRNSRIKYDSRLEDIRYSKALVLLIELDQERQSSLNYQENVGDGIKSMCAQDLKGISLQPALSVVMDEKWSDENFEKPEDEVLEKASQLILNHFPWLRLKSKQLKRWRYCAPETTWPELYFSPASGLYLAGDAFGGASLLGALRSSQGLLERLSVSSDSL